jgi:hypothetical protein
MAVYFSGSSSSDPLLFEGLYSPQLLLCIQARATQSYYTPYEVTERPLVFVERLSAHPVGFRLTTKYALQVACHNTPTDCWVSLLGAVYDVTRLLRVSQHVKPAGHVELAV